VSVPVLLTAVLCGAHPFSSAVYIQMQRAVPGLSWTLHERVDVCLAIGWFCIILGHPPGPRAWLSVRPPSYGPRSTERVETSTRPCSYTRVVDVCMHA